MLAQLGKRLIFKIKLRGFSDYIVGYNGRLCMSNISVHANQEVIEGIFQDFGPRFRADGNKIQFLLKPDDFYKELILRIRTAKKRITLASLYIGNGTLEQQLVDELIQAVRSSKCADKQLKLNILLDYTRGSRGHLSSRKMLLPLLNEFAEQLNVALYHTPYLRGLLKALVPERFNETIGLSHLKIYLFDNDLIISGANLSESYFTNRQDRYVLIESCNELANFFHDLVVLISSYSLQLKADNTTAMLNNVDVHPYKNNDNSENFKIAVREDVINLIDSYKRREEISITNSDTIIVPLIQMGQFKIRLDEDAIQQLFQSISEESKLFLASGYFNLIERHLNTILNESRGKYYILTASPSANGFFDATGVAGYIPICYTYIAKQFYQRIVKGRQIERIKLLEYERKEWTFHSKGLWYYLQQDRFPSMTLIGSSNFGYRSTYRDLEAQIAIITRNDKLKERMLLEQSNIYSYGNGIDEHVFNTDSRRVPLWIQLVTRFILWKFL